MPVIEIAIASSSDRKSLFGTNATYPPLIANGAEANLTKAQNQLSGGSYRVEVALLRFLVQLPVDAVLTDAQLRLTLTSRTNADGRNLIGNWYAWSGLPTIPDPDWTNSPSSGAFSIPLSSLTSPGTNDISLSGFMAHIKKNGFAGLRLGISGGQPTGINEIAANSSILRLFYSQVQAPTMLAIDSDDTEGLPIDRTVSHTFSWHHNESNGTPQSKAEIQYRLVGAGSWNTVTENSPNQSHVFSGGFFAVGDYEWRVRTFDTDNLTSPADGENEGYSEIKTFSARAAVATPTVTAPSGTTTTATPTITWTSSEATRTHYQARVRRTSDNFIAYDSGEVAGAGLSQAVAAANALADATPYMAEARVKVDGLWSAYGTSSFTTAFTPPSTPSIVVTNQDANGRNHIVITNPGGGGAFSQNKIDRLLPGEGKWREIKAGLGSGATYDDYHAPAKKQAQYRCRAFSTSGGFAASATQSATLLFQTDAFLHSVDDPAGTIFAIPMYEGSLTVNEVKEEIYLQLLGRVAPVVRRGTGITRSWQVQFVTDDAETVQDSIESLIATNTTLCLRTFKKHRNNRLFGQIPAHTISYDFSSNVFSFVFNETDHIEGQEVAG